MLRELELNHLFTICQYMIKIKDTEDESNEPISVPTPITPPLNPTIAPSPPDEPPDDQFLFPIHTRH